jgi:hypothetical protein
MNSEHIQSIRSKALRCRELAGAASDAEVAEELLRIAIEFEAALHVLDDQRSEGSSNSGPRLSSEALPDGAV